MKMIFLFDIICSLLIFLFVYTAVSKLTDLISFREMLQRSPVLGSYSVAASWLIPVSELLIAVALCLPGCRRAGLYASFVLLVAFTFYLLYILTFKNHNLPCSCGGVISSMSWKQHVVFNMFFIVLSFTGIRIWRKRPSPVNLV